MSWQYIWSHQVAIWIWASAVRNCPLGRCRSYSTYPTSLSGPTPRNRRPDTLQHFAPGEQPLTAYNRINIHFWGALALQDSIWCMLPPPERERMPPRHLCSCMNSQVMHTVEHDGSRSYLRFHHVVCWKPTSGCRGGSGTLLVS